MAENFIQVSVIDSISQRKTAKGKPLKLPQDVPSGRLASEVAVGIFGHGIADGVGHIYDYRFRNEEQQLLNPDQTLEQAEVRPNSKLYLSFVPTSAG